METCSHSNTFFNSELDANICEDCGAIIESHPTYMNDYKPYNFDLDNNYYDYQIEQNFNFLKTYYSPQLVKRIKETYQYLKKATGKISKSFVSVAIYFGLKDIRPIKPTQIDKLLGLQSASKRCVCHRYIEKYSYLFEMSFTDTKKIKPIYKPKRKDIIDLYTS